jgi:PPM family protein phosphatase
LLDGTWKWTSGRLTGREGERGTAMLSLLEKVDLLRNTKLFQPLPTQSLVRVAAIAYELNWEPHQMVYHEGSRAESILMVLEGEVELIRAGSVLAKIGPHQVPGALAALSNGRYSESAVVSQPTRALRMDREELFDAMAEDFRVAQGIVRALAGMANGAA